MSENNPAWEIRYTAFNRDVLLFPQHTSFLCHPWQAKLLSPTAEQVKTRSQAGSSGNAALTVQGEKCTKYPTTHPTAGEVEGNLEA